MKKQFKLITLSLFTLMGLVMVSCSGKSGTGGYGIKDDDGDGDGTDFPDATSACPNFMPLDTDISNQFTGGVNVHSGGRNIGCLTLVREIKIETSVDPIENIKYNYGLINNQGFLFYINDQGQISTTGEPHGLRDVSFVQIPLTKEEDRVHPGTVTRGHFGVCTVSYMPQNLSDIKDKRFPKDGDLRFFYAYQVEGDSKSTYGCLDISAANNIGPIIPGNFNVLQTKSSDQSARVEIWSKEVDFHTGSSYFDGRVMDHDTCLQDAFLMDAVPDYRGEITFHTETGEEIPRETIIGFAKNSNDYCRQTPKPYRCN